MYICVCWLTGSIQCAISHDELCYPAIADVLWILLLVYILFHNKILHLTTVWKRAEETKAHKIYLFKIVFFLSDFLTFKIPWTEEPGGLQSMGSLGVGHDWATSLSLFTFMHWRRKWQPSPVFLPGESQGRGSLLGCCLWGRTESDTAKVT